MRYGTHAGKDDNIKIKVVVTFPGDQESIDNRFFFLVDVKILYMRTAVHKPMEVTPNKVDIPCN